MKSQLVFLLSIAFLLGCAQPKYANSVDSLQDSQVLEAKLNCDLKFENENICLVWSWENKPKSTTDYGSLIFKTFRQNVFDQTPIEIDMDSTPQLILWMASMGHGSAPTQTERLDVGTYRAKNVLFIMPGDWQLKFKTTTNQGVEDEVISEIIF